MSVRLSMLLLAALSLVSRAQTTLPPDIHPVTLSRLPPANAEDLDEEGRRLLTARTNFTPGPGPTHITIYSPRERDLGIPSGEKSPRRSSIFSARGPDYREGDRPAVRMVRSRTGGSPAGPGAAGHRCRQVRQGRGRAIRQGCDHDQFWARSVSRTSSQQ